MFNLDNSAVLNSLYTSQDFKITFDIYKNNIGDIRGKALCKKKNCLPSIMKPYVPKTLLENHCEIRIFTDVVYMN